MFGLFYQSNLTSVREGICGHKKEKISRFGKIAGLSTLFGKDLRPMNQPVRVKVSITPSIDELSGFPPLADKGDLHGFLHQTAQP